MNNLCGVYLWLIKPPIKWQIKFLQWTSYDKCNFFFLKEHDGESIDSIKRT